MANLNPEIVAFANLNGWSYAHAKSIYTGTTCRCERCTARRREERLAYATETQRWNESFKERHHAGRCAFCSKRPAPFGKLTCAPCLKVCLAKEAARAEEEKRLASECERENRFEARAAFGPGVEVVDIITGARYRT